MNLTTLPFNTDLHNQEMFDRAQYNAEKLAKKRRLAESDKAAAEQRSAMVAASEVRNRARTAPYPSEVRANLLGSLVLQICLVVNLY